MSVWDTGGLNSSLWLMAHPVKRRNYYYYYYYYMLTYVYTVVCVYMMTYVYTVVCV